MQRGGGAPLPVRQQQILPRQMEEALQRAIREQILNDPEVHPNDHFLININSNRLRHSYHSTRMRVIQTPRNNNSTCPSFICFSVFEYLDETLALVLEIVHAQ